MYVASSVKANPAIVGVVGVVDAITCVAGPLVGSSVDETVATTVGGTAVGATVEGAVGATVSGAVGVVVMFGSTVSVAGVPGGDAQLACSHIVVMRIIKMKEWRCTSMAITSPQ